MLLTPHYSGSLDRELGRPTHLKQRAMSVSCGSGADRWLPDTRFLAQELHNLFFSGARPTGPAAAAPASPSSPTLNVPIGGGGGAAY